jgi:calcineurin-like phosphoesterase family protein
LISAVLSDLHLGMRSCVLHAGPARRRLLAELEDVDQVVLLGDLFALRDLPEPNVREAASPFFDELGRVLDGRRVVVVPGNHDHRLGGPLLDGRLQGTGPESLASETILKPGSDGLASWLAGRMPGTEVRLAYPGIWLRPDVYAIHGHYLDCHVTVPRPESLAAALMKLRVGRLPEGRVAPADYEVRLRPFYEFAYARSGAGRGSLVAEITRRVQTYGWAALTGDAEAAPHARWVGRALAKVGVAAVNKAGFGPFSAELSVDEVGRSGVSAMEDVVERLGIDAPYVLFGHTHRAGPLDGEAEWSAPGGSRLVNVGNWVYSQVLIGNARDRSPYWPGRYVRVEPEGPPALRSVLDPARIAEAMA